MCSMSESGLHLLKSVDYLKLCHLSSLIVTAPTVLTEEAGPLKLVLALLNDLNEKIVEVNDRNDCCSTHNMQSILLV